MRKSAIISIMISIKRDLYLNKLVTARHSGMIKVITGLRRCGKSFLGGVTKSMLAM